jgi:hypothetical protein
VHSRRVTAGFRPSALRSIFFFLLLNLTAAGLLLRAQVVLPYTADFETAESFTTGSLHGQNGWSVALGSASVGTSAYFSGSQGVTLTASSPPAFIAQEFDELMGEDVIFVDFYVKPVAGSNPGDTTVAVAESSEMKFINVDGDGEVYALDGDETGENGGRWVPTGYRVALDMNGAAVNWLRVTVRQDFAHRTWDLYLDGTMVLANLGFREAAASYFSFFALRGAPDADAYFDYFYAAAENPLFVDDDLDGMEDAWETMHSLDDGVDDRDGDYDSDGLTNLQEYLIATNPAVADIASIPTLISGLRLQLDADTGTTTDLNGNVSSWADQSGLSNDAAQMDSGKRPQLVAGELNGHAVLRFDGEDDKLELPDLMNGATAGEIFIVTRLSDFARPNHPYFGLVQIGTGDATIYSKDTIWDNFGTAGHHAFGLTDVSSLTAPHIFNASVTAGGGVTTAFNGLQWDSHGGETVDFTMTPLIGADAIDEFYRGDIAEILVYDHPLTVIERRAVNLYLVHKYDGSTATPAAPTDLTATILSETKVDLNWTTATTGFAGAVVERKTGEGDYEIVDPHGALDGYQDHDLTPGETYTYRVKLIGPAGGSLYSEPLPVTMPEGVADLPDDGLRLWLRSTAGASRNSPISRWADQSGNTHDAFQFAADNRPAMVTGEVNGLPVVRFDGTDDHFSLQQVMDGATEGEIFIVARLHDFTNGRNGLMQFGFANGTTYTEDQIVDDFGINDGASFSGPGGTLLTSWHLYGATVDSGGQDLKFNDQLLLHRDLPMGDPNVNYRADVMLGTDVFDEYFNGDVAEIIAYDHVLDGPEHAAVVAYLHFKYGLPGAPSLPTDVTATPISATRVDLSWTTGEIDGSADVTIERKTGGGGYDLLTDEGELSGFQDSGLTPGETYTYRLKFTNSYGETDYTDPVVVTLPLGTPDLPSSGMRLWLRAGVGTHGAGPLATWADQSGNGHDAVQATASHRPEVVLDEVNGQPVVRFDGSDDRLDLSDPMNGATAGEIFIVARLKDFTRGINGLAQFGGGNGTTYTEGAMVDDFGINTGDSFPGPDGALLTAWHTYNASVTEDGEDLRFNGHLLLHRPLPGFAPDVTFRSDAMLGTDVFDEYFNGDIAEVIVYDRVLSDDERAQVSAYLTIKYGVPHEDSVLADANSDGIDDTLGYVLLGIEPTDTDVDSDGVRNDVELASGTDPLSADTDGDSVNDDTDAYPLDPTRSSALTSDPMDHTGPSITLTLPADAVLEP